MNSSYDDYQNGTLVHYQLLERHEAVQGKEEGTKRRPCAIVLRSQNPASDRIFLIPITTRQPDKDVPALEVPQLEARRMGLHEPISRWVILNEVNVDQIPSLVMEPNAKIGDIGRSFFRQILEEFKAINQQRKMIDRGA